MQDLTHLRTILQQVGDRMTAGDIVDEYGYSRDQITAACKSLRIKLPTKAEITIRYIKEVAGHKTITEIARALGVGDIYVYQLANKIGVHLRARKDQPAVPVKKVTLSQVRMNAALVEYKKKISADYKEPRKERIREGYNQSGSPYGIADEMKNIEVR